MQWLADQDASWRARAEVVAMDGSSGFKPAAGEELPDAVTVMDSLHVVRLAADVLDQCRRRVQQRPRGPCDRTGDPLHSAKRTPAHRQRTPHRATTRTPRGVRRRGVAVGGESASVRTGPGPGTARPGIRCLVAPSSNWPALPYQQWSATRDTLHAHTQVLGKLAAALAPPEPQLQHAALRLTARGWETQPLPAPDGSGTFVVVLDLHAHHVLVEHSDGGRRRIPLSPHRSVGAVTRDVLAAVQEAVGQVAF